jgi:uncharacterized protein YegL
MVISFHEIEDVVMKTLQIPRLTPSETALLRNCTIIEQEKRKREREYEINRPALYVELPPTREKREERWY